MRFIPDIRYDVLENSFLDLYLPDGECKDLLIWFHGGGLVSYSRKNILFAEDLTAQGIGIASVEYRLYPQAKFPDFLMDAAQAVKFLLDNIKNYADPERIFISGQSAGAYITLMLAFDNTYFENAGVDRAAISGYISDSAQITTHYSVLEEKGIPKILERIDEAAAIYHLSKESKVNNLLLIYYTDDIPCRPEQNLLFYKSIRKVCPEINVAIKELPGEHTNGSIRRNIQGTFDYCDALLDFINRI